MTENKGQKSEVRHQRREYDEARIENLMLLLVIDYRFAKLSRADVGALKIARSLSGSADPSSQGAAAAPIWPSLPYRAGTRRIPVRART